MAIYKAKELRAMTKEELNEKLQQLETELGREKGAVASGTKPENPGKIREMRKTIARILTIMKEKQKLEVKPKK